MQIKVSVIVPVYNCEIYLEQCIESILAQTFSDFELILIDDGALDNSGKICDKYALNDVRIKVIHKKNGGVSSARNAGIELAQGEYITFIDSDDYVDKDFFERAYRDIAIQQADLFISGITMEQYEKQSIIKENKYNIIQSKVFTPKQLLETWGQEFPAICCCGPWNKFFKANIIKENGLRFDLSLNCGEDTYFNLHVLEKIEKIYFSKEIFYHYRRESLNSLWSRFHGDIYEINYKVSGKQRELMDWFGCSLLSKNAFENNYFSLQISGLHEYYRNYDKTTTAEKLELINKIITDEYIHRYRLRDIDGIRNKIFLLLFKMKWVKVIDFIFKKKYIKKS